MLKTFVVSAVAVFIELELEGGKGKLVEDGMRDVNSETWIR
jgi:hypothetical protein